MFYIIKINSKYDWKAIFMQLNTVGVVFQLNLKFYFNNLYFSINMI